MLRFTLGVETGEIIPEMKLETDSEDFFEAIK